MQPSTDPSTRLRAMAIALRKQLVTKAIREGLIKAENQLVFIIPPITIKNERKVTPATRNLTLSDWKAIFALPWNARQVDILRAFQNNDNQPTDLFGIQTDKHNRRKTAKLNALGQKDIKPVGWKDLGYINVAFARLSSKYYMRSAIQPDGRNIRKRGENVSLFQIFKKL